MPSWSLWSKCVRCVWGQKQREEVGLQKSRLDSNGLWEPEERDVHLCLVGASLFVGLWLLKHRGKTMEQLGHAEPCMNQSQGQWRVKTGPSHGKRTSKHTRKRLSQGSEMVQWRMGLQNPSYPSNQMAMTATSCLPAHVQGHLFPM